MRIAIPVWNGRVSPVLDAAQHLLVVDLEDATELARDLKTLTQGQLIHRALCIADLGVEILFCWAISKPLESILEAKGVRVIPNVRGATEEILKAFLAGKINHRTSTLASWK